jgi:flagellar protein FliO/FliZ
MPPVACILLLARQSPPIDPAQPAGSDSFAWMLLQTLLALAVVCGLMYVLFRWVLPRLSPTGSQRGMVRVVDAVTLEPRRNLYVIEVTGRWLLIASSEAGVQLIGELDAAAAKQEEELHARGRANRRGLGSAAVEVLTGSLARLKNRR